MQMNSGVPPEGSLGRQRLGLIKTSVCLFTLCLSLLALGTVNARLQAEQFVSHHVGGEI